MQRSRTTPMRPRRMLMAIAVGIAAIGLVDAGRHVSFAGGDSCDALKRSALDLRHQSANLLRALATIEGSRGNFDAALRYAVEGARLDPAPPADLVTGSMASAELTHIAQGLDEELVLSAHADGLNTAHFSRDGKWIVTGADDNTARLWDAVSGALIRTFRHDDHVASVAFSPDGSQIVTATDHRVAIWNARTGKQSRAFQTNSIVTKVEFSRDGKNVVVATAEDVRTLNVADGKLVATAPAEESQPGKIYVSPDGKHRIGISVDSSDIELDPDANGEHGKLLKGHRGGLLQLVFSPDGRRFVTISEDSTPRIWSTETGDALGVLRGHTGSVASVAFSQDGNRIVTASADKTARVWNVRPAKPTVAFQAHDMRPVPIDDKGSTVKTVYYTVSAAFSPDATHVVTVESDGTARAWDIARSKQVAMLRGDMGSIVVAAFSPDGTQITTGSKDGTVRTWNVVTGQAIGTPRRLGATLAFGDISADGTRIVATTGDGTIKVWDVASGRELSARRLYDSREAFVRFAPDGLRVVTAQASYRDPDRTVSVWNTTKPNDIVVLPDYRVTAAALSRDGSRLVTGTDSGTIRIWQMSDAKMLTEIEGHAGAIVNSIAFSPDAMRIATVSADATLRIWDAATGQEIAIVDRTESEANSVAFSPDGRQLLIATNDDTTSVYDVHLATMPTKDLVAETCARRLRGLSRMSRAEMRQAGYPDSTPEVDVCAGLSR